MDRKATIRRTTKETDIEVTICLDGTGKTDIETGIGFFDHMLDGFARHGLFDLTVKAAGDLDVDCHHTVEDTGIVLGSAILEALGGKEGIPAFRIRYYAVLLVITAAIALFDDGFDLRICLLFAYYLVVRILFRLLNAPGKGMFIYYK